MAITLSAPATTAAVNAACNAIVDLVDTNGPGTIVLRTGASAEVATLTFAATAFGAAVAGVATAAPIVNDSSATGSVSFVTNFTVEDGDSTEIWNGTVGESGADLNIDDGTVDGNVVIDTGAVVSISAITFTVAFA